MSQLFCGYLRSELICPSCGKSSSNFELFQDLSLEVKDGTESIWDALETFTNPEVLDIANKYFCSECKREVRAEKRLSVNLAPNVLVLRLKRFRVGFQGKINKKVSFPVDLVLRKNQHEDAQKDKALYKLFGAVVHLDMFDISSFGHYIAFVRDCRSNWWKLDDHKVESVSQASVLKQKAYLLFYVRTSQSIVIPPKSDFNKLEKLEEVKIAESMMEKSETKSEPPLMCDIPAASIVPEKCANGCGFFGNPQTRNLCSQCFSKLHSKEAKILEDHRAIKLAEERVKLQKEAKLSRIQAQVEAARAANLREAERQHF